MKRIGLIAVVAAMLPLAGCENMQAWSELFKGINEKLVPIAVIKKSSEAVPETPRPAPARVGHHPGLDPAAGA